MRADFSTRSEIWGECTNCEWENGELYFGPFEPVGSGTDQIFYMLCELCGEHNYYRVAADVTFFEGFGADRTIGILAGLSAHDFLGAGTVSTSKHALYETFNFKTNSWGGTSFQRFNTVNSGWVTNRIEVVIRPGTAPNKADIQIYVNGVNVIYLFNQDNEPSKVGLYLGWHSIGVTFDNFEFEVLENE